MILSGRMYIDINTSTDGFNSTTADYLVVELEREEHENPCGCEYEVVVDEWGRSVLKRVKICPYCFSEIGALLESLRGCWERVDVPVHPSQRCRKHDDSNRNKVLLEYRTRPPRSYGDRRAARSGTGPELGRPSQIGWSPVLFQSQVIPSGWRGLVGALGWGSLRPRANYL